MSRLPARLLRSSTVAALALSGGLVAPGEGTAQHRPSARAAATIDSLMRAAVDARQVAGISVAVVRGSDTILVRAHGLAEVENAVPATSQHVFQIASVTKEFTGAAVLLLVQDGKLSLDDDVTTYLPDAPTQGKRVTVRQLLSHTAGLVDVPDLPRFQLVKRRDLPPDSIIALAQGEPFYFPPGEQMRYSNTGFLLAGRLIERLSGQTFADFVAARLLRPAGMSSSRYCDQRALIPRIARGYDFTPQGFRPASFLNLQIPFAAGGLCSTALDLVAWNQALFGGKLLAPAMLAELVKPNSVSGHETRYGLGVGLGTIAGRRAYHHGGDIDGFTSYLAWFPDDSLSVAVLINTQGPVRPDPLVARIADAVLGPHREPAATAPNDLARFAGRYGGDVVVTVSGDGLTLVRGPLPPTKLRHSGGTTFTDGRARYTFEPGSGPAARMWADLMWAFVRWDRDTGETR